ncbi:MAG: ATP-binding protein [Planctomycetaceae bacterium]|nr:ATP-binding protein [Planctomycetaceae bacterium]
MSRPHSSGQPPAELRLLTEVLDTLQDPVAVTEPPTEGSPPRLLYANQAFLRLCPNDVRPDRATIANDVLAESLAESHRHQGVYTADVVCPTANTMRAVLRLRSEPVCDETGRIIRRIAVFHDATTERNLEEALRRNERLASIGLLGAAIAHEINNPAGSALLAAETGLRLLDTPGASDRLRVCFKNIVASMDRCGKIVRTLLRYSRQEPTERQACRLNDVVEQAVELARPYAESRCAQLHLTLDPNLPLAPMNPLEIELVLINLIRNAAEAGGREGVKISIHTTFTDQHVKAAITDDGCGMNEEQLAHVFEFLYTTRRQVGGSGIGLGIAQGIVQAHAGRIQVHSRPDNGTTVIVELPIT